MKEGLNSYSASRYFKKLRFGMYLIKIQNSPLKQHHCSPEGTTNKIPSATGSPKLGTMFSSHENFCVRMFLSHP